MLQEGKKSFSNFSFSSKCFISHNIKVRKLSIFTRRFLMFKVLFLSLSIIKMTLFLSLFYRDNCSLEFFGKLKIFFFTKQLMAYLRMSNLYPL